MKVRRVPRRKRNSKRRQKIRHKNKRGAEEPETARRVQEKSASTVAAFERKLWGERESSADGERRKTSRITVGTRKSVKTYLWKGGCPPTKRVSAAAETGKQSSVRFLECEASHREQKKRWKPEARKRNRFSLRRDEICRVMEAQRGYNL